MFDIGADEILLTTVVAIVAIGPRELPRAMHLAGRWIGKFRRMSGAVRNGFETMIREAELSELEQNWSAGRDAVIERYAEQERLRKLAEAAAEPAAADTVQPDIIHPETTPSPRSD